MAENIHSIRVEAFSFTFKGLKQLVWFYCAICFCLQCIYNTQMLEFSWEWKKNSYISYLLFIIEVCLRLQIKIKIQER